MTTASTASSDGFSLDDDGPGALAPTSSKRRFSEEHSRSFRSLEDSFKSKEEVEAELGFSPLRLRVRGLLRHTACDVCVGTVILLNVALMMLEANHTAACYPDICYNPAISWPNRGFLAIYTIEAMLRAYVDRERYFRDGWNILDFSIVVFSWLDVMLEVFTVGAPEGMQMLPVLRIFRILRLTRALRLLKLFPELYVMVREFLGAMKVMAWGFLGICALIMIWSLVIVQSIHPVLPSTSDPDHPFPEYCQDAFTGVLHMALLLFQTLVAGDSWGHCMLPVIFRAPWTFLPFGLALVSVSLGFMNLILAAIVENAVRARGVELEEMAQQKKRSEKKAIQMWMAMAKRIDRDGNNALSQDEMFRAFEDETFRATMESLGIDRQDLIHIFQLMDMDESGDLDYDEFIDSFLKAHEMDERVYMMMTKLQADHMARHVKRIMEWVKPQAPVEAPGSRPSAPALDVHSALLDADVQRINERIQEQFDALTAVFEAAAAAAAAAAAPAEANSMPPGADYESTRFGADFECINERIQEQFHALARSLETNAATLTWHTDALKDTATLTRQTDALKATVPATYPATLKVAAAAAEGPAALPGGARPGPGGAAQGQRNAAVGASAKMQRWHAL